MLGTARPPAKAGAVHPTETTTLSPYVVVGCAVVLHVLMMAAVFNPMIFTGGDNAVYQSLARSLLERGAYLNIHEPGALPHTQYPPGYPVIIAIASLVGIKPWVGLKLLGTVFAAAGVAFTALWALRHTTPMMALAVSTVVGLSPGILTEGQHELSDVPFWAIVMISLWALEGLPRESTRRIVIAGAAAAFAYLTRTAAIPLVVAGLAWLAWERRWKQLAIFAAFTLPVVAGWALWVNAVGAEATNTGYERAFWLKEQYNPGAGEATFLEIFQRIPGNAGRYAAWMIPQLLTTRSFGANTILGVVVILLVLVGWVRSLRASLPRPDFVDVFFGLYLGMLALLPVDWGAERFLFPILPVALVYAAETILWPMRGWAPRTRVLAAALPVTVVALLAAAPLTRMAMTGSFCRDLYARGDRYGCLGVPFQDYLRMAEWARIGLPEDAIVVSRKPGLFYAISGRVGVNVPQTADPDEFLDTAQKAGAEFLVLDQVDFLSPRFVAPAIQHYPNSYCVARQGGIEGHAVFGIVWAAPRVPAPEAASEIIFRPCPGFTPAPEAGDPLTASPVPPGLPPVPPVAPGPRAPGTR